MFFAVMIIIIVYLPIMVLQGIEGKMFRPMALTVVFALVASLVLALTLMPVLSVMMFRKRIPHRTPRLVAWLLSLYRPLLDRVLSHPRLAGAGAALVFALRSCWSPSWARSSSPSSTRAPSRFRSGGSRA